MCKDLFLHGRCLADTSSSGMVVHLGRVLEGALRTVYGHTEQRSELLKNYFPPVFHSHQFDAFLHTMLSYKDGPSSSQIFLVFIFFKK